MNEEQLAEMENAHYELQVGMYFSGIKKIKGASVGYSDFIDDGNWNYATEINAKDSTKFFDDAEKTLNEMNRKPCIYVTPWTKPRNLAEIAEKRGYKKTLSDAWMVYKGPKPDSSCEITVKKVESKEEMRTFADLFQKCYSNPDDPYGVLPPSYSRALINSFRVNDENKTVNHYLFLDKNKGIGIATLIHNEKYGGIYNVGSLPEARKKGIGSTATLYCVKQAMDKNVDNIFLLTEENSYNEKFYTKLGFKTEFVGTAYMRDQA